MEQIGSLAEANRFLEKYLPKYNRRFCVAAADKVDVHRPVPEGLNLYSILCVREQRVVRNDGTVMFESGLYQIREPGRLGKVTVERRLNGSLRFSDRGRKLEWAKVAARPPGGRAVRPSTNEKPAPKEKSFPRPNPTPWRKFSYSRKRIRKMKRDLVAV